jgi:hypothetical protein
MTQRRNSKLLGIVTELEAIEQAIRNALAKADVTNAEHRQRVYESAWGAHERSLAANERLDDAQRQTRRERLKSVIMRIEAEMTAPKVAPAPVPEPRIEPSIDVSPEPTLGSPEPVYRETPEPDNYRPEKQSRRAARREAKAKRSERKKATGLTKFLIIAALLAVALGLLWSVASGLINTKPGSIPASTGNPAANGSHEPLKEGELPSEAAWLAVFDPSDPSKVSTSGGATATPGGDKLEKYLSIKSVAEADEVSFPVSQEVLQELAGKTALFDIVARTPDGTASQMAVSCDFGALGNCGRKRYDISDASKEYLVQVKFPADKQAAAAGTIRINSDISGAGKPVEIIAIRVQIEN